MQIINTLVPIFLLIGAGTFLRQQKMFSEDFFKALGKLVFYVGLPLLLFNKISTAVFNVDDVKKIIIVTLLAIAAIFIIAYIVVKILKVPKKSCGTFIQASIRLNLAFVGIPVIFYAFGDKGNEMTQIAVLAMAPMIPITTPLALLTLILMGGTDSNISFKEIVLKVVKNPLVLVTLTALPFSIFQIPIPKSIFRSTQALGQMALPLALLSIGASLTLSKIKGSVLLASIASSLNVFILPFLGYLIGMAFGMTRDEMLITMIFLACPAASSSYVLVQQIGGDENLAGSAVVISTLMSAISLFLVMLFFS